MIQRKQSLFLILAVIAYAVCLFLPIASVSASGMGADSMVYNLGVVNGDSGISVSSTCLPLFLLLAVSAVISLEIKQDLSKKLAEFASYNDSLEEVFENREQIEISRFYEKLPKPTLIATEEFIEKSIYWRDPSMPAHNQDEPAF